MEADLTSTWLVTVAGEPRTRLLKISGVAEKSDGSLMLSAAYGYSDGKQSPIQAQLTQDQKLVFTTGADSQVSATRFADGPFVGMIIYKSGVTKKITIAKVVEPSSASALATPAVSLPKTGAVGPKNVHLVWMGGNDCPPCVAWRGTELPKLEKTEVFKSVTFTYVVKTIQSTVPPVFFLPPSVKALKEKLDIANNGSGGSPQFAIVVNGEVFDYNYGVVSAEEMEKMLLAIRDGTPYPRERCIKISLQVRRGCLVKG